MKMMVIIVQDTDANKLQSALVEASFQATKLSSTGGFLRQGNTTFLIGAENENVEQVKSIVKKTCKERTKPQPINSLGASPEPYFGQIIDVSVGGAVVFVLNVESFERV